MSMNNIPLNPAAFCLIIEEGPGAGRYFLLRNGQYSIGRARFANNDIILPYDDYCISRSQHAILAVKDSLFLVFSCSKANVVQVNNVIVRDSYAASIGDVLLFGRTKMRIALPSAAQTIDVVLSNVSAHRDHWKSNEEKEEWLLPEDDLRALQSLDQSAIASQLRQSNLGNFIAMSIRHWMTRRLDEIR